MEICVCLFVGNKSNQSILLKIHRPDSKDSFKSSNISFNLFVYFIYI